MNRRSILAAYKKKSSHLQTGVTGFKSGNLFKKIPGFEGEKLTIVEKFQLFSFTVGHCSIHSRYFAFMIFLVLSLFFWLYHSFKKQPTSSKLSKSRIASIGTLPPQSCSQSYQINVRIISSGVSALVKKFSLRTFRTLAISWILSSLGIRNPDSY